VELSYESVGFIQEVKNRTGKERCSVLNEWGSARRDAPRTHRIKSGSVDAVAEDAKKTRNGRERKVGKNGASRRDGVKRRIRQEKATCCWETS